MRNPENPSSLKAWLQTRSPAVPSAFLPFLLESGSGTPDEQGLSRLGLRALSRALSGPGTDRSGAFHLLTADAFLTYACEAVAEGDGDVRAGLEGILDRIGGDYR